MKYIISAMVVCYDITSVMAVYCDTVEAISEEEAIDIFCADCPYDVDANTIDIIESEVEE